MLNRVAKICLFVGLVFGLASCSEQVLLAQDASTDASVNDMPSLADQEIASTAESTAGPSNGAVEKGGFGRREALLASLTIFMLAVFVGFELITKVPPTLHTPLMSGSNAISGVTLVGAVLVAGLSSSGFGKFLGMLAVAMAGVNCVGGFMVTDRMLSMFKGKGKKK